MAKKKNNEDRNTFLLVLAGAIFASMLLKKTLMKKEKGHEQSVLDAAEINGKTLGVNENGDLVIYDKR